MFQVGGDGNTEFVVHGFGWPPGHWVTLALPGHGSAQKKVFVDRAGTFNYAIGHDPVFFPGPMPQGWYQVVVTAPGIRAAHTRFDVTAGPPPGSPNGPPPANP